MKKKQITIHKSNASDNFIKVSVILLDWSCRERFHTLDWLNNQNVPREQYELIWVELFDRVVQEALDKADVVITCGQKELYHKHMGYNIGLLHSKGRIITICDSDAVFPPDFIDSIINSFNFTDAGTPDSLVLMHHQWRSPVLYPDGLKDINELQRYPWADLWPNVGACMSIVKSDAMRYGGFDEHRSFRGYICGPYDLGWRLINAGLTEKWHDQSIALWHFSHPDPPATYGQPFSLKLCREKSYPHIDHHALSAVEAFSTGRLLPLRENPEIFKIRMSQRNIGTKFEEKYAWITGQKGFSTFQRLKLRALFFLELPKMILKLVIIRKSLQVLQIFLGIQRYETLRKWWRTKKADNA
jgi:glycosyltransferase involved in cell wall biosynthesis